MQTTFNKTILLAAKHSIPQINSKKISKYTENAWQSKDCKRAVSLKKVPLKKWLKNRTEETFVSLKRAKTQCNRIVAQAKKIYWTTFCKNVLSESKHRYEVWKKVKELKKIK